MIDPPNWSRLDPRKESICKHSYLMFGQHVVETNVLSRIIKYHNNIDQ